MSKRSVAVWIMAALLSSCAYTPEVTVMVGPRRINSTGDPDFAATIAVMQLFGERGHGVVGCVHQSEPQHGTPFNDDAEETFDTCGAGARWGGKRW